MRIGVCVGAALVAALVWDAAGARAVGLRGGRDRRGGRPHVVDANRAVRPSTPAAGKRSRARSASGRRSRRDSASSSSSTGPVRSRTDSDLPIFVPTRSSAPRPGGIIGGPLPDFGFPSIISQTTRVRTTTTSALVYARQPLGSRFELVYLGGVGFSRVVREIEFGFPRVIVPLPPGILPQSYSTRTTQYAAGPVVGVEMRAGMTEHMQLVAGLRVHTVGQSVVDGWMIRPSVGLAWKF